MMSTRGQSGGDRIGKWLLAVVCWWAVWAADPPTNGQAESAPAQARPRPSPKAWIQQYLGVEFPRSARHFVLYYRSSEEDIVLFSFDLARDDLPRLMNGRGILPAYDDLRATDSELPARVVRDSGSRAFAQTVAAMRNARFATKRRVAPGEWPAVQLWTAEASVERWKVCVSIITDGRAGEAAACGGFKMPVVSQEARDCVTVDSRLEQIDDTEIWQRWSLDEAGYRDLVRMLGARPNVERDSGDAAERRADRLESWGPAAEVTWWRPSELKHGDSAGSEPLKGFRCTDSGVTTAMVIGRVDGLFRCYAHTRCRVLVPDAPDAIWRLLGLELPSSVSDVHYQSVSSPAGIVFWARFDLPLPDLAACLAQTPILPTYAEFTADAAARRYLDTAYRTGAPAWWHPQELSPGVYVWRVNSTKELHDLAVGFGHPAGENIRVYIGAFSAW